MTPASRGAADAAPRHLGYPEALARVLAASTPAAPVREPLERCAGRALREPLVAPHPLPPFRNAAMDGWAVRAADLAGATEAAPATLPVVAVIAAGGVAPRTLAAGGAMRIMTGAMVPEGADAVLPFEDGERLADAGGEAFRTGRAIRGGENVRDAGADVAAGDTVLEAGRMLSAHDVALLVALGARDAAVGALPRVAVLSTGDELLGIGEALRPGAIRDSNLPMLAQLVREAPAEVVLAERLPDDPERIAQRLADALEAADVVLSIGGVSAGDFDPVKRALTRFGGLELWRVAMRPGRPQAFGAPAGKLYFGLPGNPASVACVFEALVRPALRHRQGFTELSRPRVPVRAARGIASAAGRTDFVRCALAWRDGALWATPAGAQVSGHLSPQSRADALLVVPAEREALAEGDPAEALVLRLPAAPAQ
jgi:molybdopterin molybdotransferase